MINTDVAFPEMSEQEKIISNTKLLRSRLYEKMYPFFFMINEECYLLSESYQCILKVEDSAEDFDIKIFDTNTGQLLGTVKFIPATYYSTSLEMVFSVKLLHNITKCLLNRTSNLVSWNSKYCEPVLYVDSLKGEVEITNTCELKEKLDE